MFAAATNVVDWILAKLPVLVFVLIFVAQLIRGFFRSRGGAPAPTMKPDALEEQRRVQEVQEQIRRRIAERRGEAPSPERPPLEQVEAPSPPLRRPIETTQMPEPFGGPLRRVMEEIQREIQAAPEPPALPQIPQTAERSNAELVRQEVLADELRSIDESRILTERRAVKAAAVRDADAHSETGLRTVARGKIIEELRDPQALRRAFVLREVLGPPVAFR